VHGEVVLQVREYNFPGEIAFIDVRWKGAGWGGCTVSLVTESQVPAFIASIRRAYAPYEGLDDIKLRDVIFSTKPGGGAAGKSALCSFP
jgi:galactokinase